MNIKEKRATISWQAVVLAAITALPPTIMATATWFKSESTHQAVNGGMTKVLSLVSTGEHAKGVVDEKEAQKERETKRENNEPPPARPPPAK